MAAAEQTITAILERSGSMQDTVLTITVPRTDLNVSVEGMEVPAAAGLASVFHFYRCSCGKMNVIGQFCLANYEVNDVIDALRSGHVMEIISVGPMLLHERPPLRCVRFQGEGNAEPLARTIREALRCTGKERMAPSDDWTHRRD
jgi:hypothetical protein